MRQKKIILALIALVSLASASCAKLQARDNLNKGVRAFRDGKYETAVNHFKEAIQLDPSLTNAELYLATAYSQQFIPGGGSPENQGYADLAAETFQKVLNREPNNVSAVAGLAGIYQNTHQYQKAREFYLKHASMEPENPTAHYSVGSVNWIIAFDKENPPSDSEKATLIDEGQQHLDKALAINPDYEDAMTYKNLLYRVKADMTVDEAEKKTLTDQADEWFNKALETRKKNAEKKGPGGIVMGK